MNYTDYRQYREWLVKKDPNLIRLDCLNPVKSLDFMVRQPPVTYGRGDPYKKWLEVTGLRFKGCSNFTSFGVRDSLEAILRYFVADEVIIPQDVYPKYEEIVSGAILARIVKYNAISDINLSRCLFTSSTSSILLITSPLSPLGRNITEREVKKILGWLDESSERIVIVDAVYTFDFDSTRKLLKPLMKTNRCFAMFSCSKSWLNPLKMGVTFGPQYVNQIKDLMPAHKQFKPSSELLNTLEHNPDLPSRMQKAFTEKWKHLATFIKRVSPNWEPPTNGYMGVVPVPFKDLYEAGMLAVPASVFGSKRENMSVVSCLYDMRTL